MLPSDSESAYGGNKEKGAPDEEDGDFDDEDEEPEPEDEDKEEAEEKDDDEEGFGDEDEDDNKGKVKIPQKKTKVSNAGLLVCSMHDTIKKKYLPDINQKLQEIVTLSGEKMHGSFHGKYNEWYPMDEKWISTLLLCSGMDTLDQTYNIDNNRFVITHALDNNPYKVGGFCGSEFFLNRTDPRQNPFV